MRSPTAVLFLCSLAPAQFFVANAGPQPPMPTDQLVYDSVRGRHVALLETGTWEFDGLHWHAGPGGTQPTPRYEHAMVFDGQRVLLYGGQDATSISAPALGDFWSYDGAAWTPIATSGPSPGLRRGHAMAWDSARQRLVLYGGTDMLGTFPNDTWEWDGTTWTPMPVPSPGSRVWHRMVFDPVRNRVVMCGGAMNPVVYRDTQEWDGTSWTLTNPNELPPRLNHGLVYDHVRAQVVLVGGQDAVGMGDAAYAYDGTTGDWDSLGSVGAPMFFLQTAAAFDIAHGRTVVLTNVDVFEPLTTRLFFGTGTLTASYTSFGPGCPGGPGTSGGRPTPGVVPLLEPQTGTLPVLGTVFGVQLGELGNGSFAMLSAGFSNTSWNGQPLPFDLAPFGMPGCPLRIDPLFAAPMQAGPAGLLQLQWDLPAIAGLSGLVFHHQALLLDATAPGGIGCLSNACTAVLQ